MRKPYQRIAAAIQGQISGGINDDDELFFDYEQGIIYDVELLVFFKNGTLSTSPNGQMNWSATNTPVYGMMSNFKTGTILSGQLIALNAQVALREFVAGSNYFFNTAFSPYPSFYQRGIFLDNTSDGTLQFRWGPQTTQSNILNRLANSWIRATPLEAVSEAA